MKGNRVDLPYMGVLRATKFKRNRKSVDFNKTKQEGKTIYFEDDKTAGYSCRLTWNRFKSISPIRCFFPVRSFKRTLAKEFIAGAHRLFELR